jgi:hypothetical protein
MGQIWPYGPTSQGRRPGPTVATLPLWPGAIVLATCLVGPKKRLGRPVGVRPRAEHAPALGRMTEAWRSRLARRIAPQASWAHDLPSKVTWINSRRCRAAAERGGDSPVVLRWHGVGGRR